MQDSYLCNTVYTLIPLWNNYIVDWYTSGFVVINNILQMGRTGIEQNAFHLCPLLKLACVFSFQNVWFVLTISPISGFLMVLASRWFSHFRQNLNESYSIDLF